MTPLILLPADVREHESYVWHAAGEKYLRAIAWMGAAPVILPSLGETIDLEAVLSRVDGVMLTGSRSNVHPARYGDEPSPRYEPYDLARDETTFRLIPLVLEMGIPLFAICRGVQELNVALGGTLITEAQERPGSMDHRAPIGPPNDERFKLVHDVTFEEGSELAKLLKAGCIRVNSVHRQVLGELSPRLVVEARAPDGTIEAVRVKDASNFAFGVQWHPEYWASSDAPSGALFRVFGDAARERARQGLPMAAE